MRVTQALNNIYKLIRCLMNWMFKWYHKIAENFDRNEV